MRSKCQENKESNGNFETRALESAELHICFFWGFNQSTDSLVCEPNLAQWVLAII